MNRSASPASVFSRLAATRNMSSSDRSRAASAPRPRSPAAAGRRAGAARAAPPEGPATAARHPRRRRPRPGRATPPPARSPKARGGAPRPPPARTRERGLEPARLVPEDAVEHGAHAARVERLRQIVRDPELDGGCDEAVSALVSSTTRVGSRCWRRKRRSDGPSSTGISRSRNAPPRPFGERCRRPRCRRRAAPSRPRAFSKRSPSSSFRRPGSYAARARSASTPG